MNVSQKVWNHYLKFEDLVFRSKDKRDHVRGIDLMRGISSLDLHRCLTEAIFPNQLPNRYISMVKVLKVIKKDRPDQDYEMLFRYSCIGDKRFSADYLEVIKYFLSIGINPIIVDIYSLMSGQNSYRQEVFDLLRKHPKLSGHVPIRLFCYKYQEEINGSPVKEKLGEFISFLLQREESFCEEDFNYLVSGLKEGDFKEVVLSHFFKRGFMIPSFSKEQMDLLKELKFYPMGSFDSPTGENHHPHSMRRLGENCSMIVVPDGDGFEVYKNVFYSGPNKRDTNLIKRVRSLEKIPQLIQKNIDPSFDYKKFLIVRKMNEAFRVL